MACNEGRGPNDAAPLPLVGECLDGKRFITRQNDIGYTSYYEGERLVGRVQHGLIVLGSCPCPGVSFEGTLSSVRCEVTSFEALCDRVAPERFEPAFGRGGCACELP
jgi:hypothetical protein